MSENERSEASGSPSSAEDQYLTFVLSDEEYGVDILRVQEIRGFESVTRIPNSPPHVLGVLNLRGSIVPIVDLRLRFRLEAVEYGPTTVIVVARVENEAGSRVVGMVVDGVSDVCNVAKSNIKPAPNLGDSMDTRFLSGLATIEDRMVILLNLDQLLCMGEVEAEVELAG